MSDDKNSLEQAVDQAMDTFVYAPIGLLFDGPALFPKLVEKGRTQVKVARMMGQMAVQMGQTEAGKRVAKAQGQVRDSLASAGIVPTPAPPGAQKPAQKGAAKKAPAQKGAAKKAPAKKAQSKARKVTPKKAAARSRKIPNVSSLGIQDYDSLSASQVVSRLRGLAADDLTALKTYEAATRARKTILNRITQLQKD